MRHHEETTMKLKYDDYKKIAEKVLEEVREKCPDIDVTVEDVENIIRGYDAGVERIKQALKTKHLVRSAA
jgi:hypothetical protein